jgi:hypothetical protein
MKLHYIFPLALTLCGAPALADRTPPADALPLSVIVTGLETQYDIQFIDEIDWDEDGYWDVEFYTKAGAKVELKINPVTGEARR